MTPEVIVLAASLMVTVIGALIAVYVRQASTEREHETRIEALEKWREEYEEKIDKKLDKIIDTITDIKIKIG
jgi:phosphoglycolate phosphatase-like HAD superfamily hydrolase